MRKKVLILYYTQFGYHIDSYMYARYADREKIDLHYFCFDKGAARVYLPGVTVKYIHLHKNRFISFFNYFIGLKKYIREKKFDVIFQIDGKFTPLIRLMNLRSPMVLDIRTGDLSDSGFRLFLRNKCITFSAMLYRKVSVITGSLLKELNLSPQKTVVIPLGGEDNSFAPKNFRRFNLLYVGSLENRNINETIIGLSGLIKSNPGVEISYDIIGFGKYTTEKMISNLIKSTGMSGKIFFHGSRYHSDLIPFLDKCNVGIVYIPMKRYYDFQSSTKFYEYLLAGMPVIATNTYENRISLKENCGVLCDDNPESFAEAVSKLIQNSGNYDSEYIKSKYWSSQWINIVRNIWEPYILDNFQRKSS